MLEQSILEQEHKFSQLFQTYKQESEFYIRHGELHKGCIIQVLTNHDQIIMMVLFKEYDQKYLKLFTLINGNFAQKEFFLQDGKIELLNNSNKRIVLQKGKLQYDEFKYEPSQWQCRQIIEKQLFYKNVRFQISANDEFLFVINYLKITQWQYQNELQLWINIKQVEVTNGSNFDVVFAQYFRSTFLQIYSTYDNQLSIQLSYLQLCDRKLKQVTTMKFNAISRWFCINQILIIIQDDRNLRFYFLNRQSKKIISVQQFQKFSIQYIQYSSQKQYIFVVTTHEPKAIQILKRNTKNQLKRFCKLQVQQAIREILILQNGDLLTVVQEDLITYFRLY